jgi:DNA repair exonuclease SbcCD nuclease subunit
MSTRSFRFVHAADFHLETPVGGIAEIPDHLRDPFLDAPYLAAERVFSTALAEEADFLVLSGDILDPQTTGPRGPLFLAGHFRRLAERGIKVYWAGGRCDPPEAWPSWLPLPENVYVFPGGRLAETIHRRDGVPLARLVGASRARGRAIRPGDFPSDTSALYSVAVIHGRSDGQRLKVRPIHYWALGGSHAPQSLFTAPYVAHYPGTPQGRQPRESGPHGCTLVNVNPEQQAELTLMPADCLRWHDECLAVDDPATADEVAARMRDRLQALTESAGGTQMLISWTISGGVGLVRKVRREGLAVEWLAMLRREAGPAVWSVGLRVEPSGPLPKEWYEQETLLGDFLRRVRHYQMNPQEPLELEPFLSEAQLAGWLGSIAALQDPAARERVLDEAAMLGVDLLGGEGGPS